MDRAGLLVRCLIRQGGLESDDSLDQGFPVCRQLLDLRRKILKAHGQRTQRIRVNPV